MSSTIKAAIQALKGRIADAYTAIVAKGGTLPATQDSANLPAAIESIPQGAQEYIPDTFTQLTSVTLTSTAVLNSGGLDIGIMSCSKIELKISGASDSTKKAVIASSTANGSWWIAWVGNETLQSSGVTFSQGTPSYTYSEAFDGNAHIITLIPAANDLGNGLRFFGFGDASYNRARNFYDIKLYSGGDDLLISHLVPVKRIADSAIGFYDSLRQKFFDYSSYLSE